MHFKGKLTRFISKKNPTTMLRMAVRGTYTSKAPRSLGCGRLVGKRKKHSNTFNRKTRL